MNRTQRLDLLYHKMTFGRLAAMLTYLIVAGAATTVLGVKAREASQTAKRAWQNVDQAKRAAAIILSNRPRLIGGDAENAVEQLVEQALHAAQLDDRAMRSRSMRSFGTMGDTGVSRNQAHVEFAGITQVQSGQLLARLETGQRGIHVESADLVVAAGERWDLSINLDWYQAASK